MTQVKDRRVGRLPNRSTIRRALCIGTVLATFFTPFTAGAAEPFDGSCGWEADRDQPNPVVIQGFKTGSAAVPANQEAEIIEFAKQAGHFSKVCVIGQADKRGAYTDNDKLAMQRARAVAARLIGAGLEPENLSLSSQAEAFGDGFPSWFWSAGNRRVEIIAME